jgi:VWFA-related protein
MSRYATLALFATIFCIFLCTEAAPLSHGQVRITPRVVSNSELVRVPVIVFDDKGSIATGLTKDDFRIFEDGVEQHILSYNRERVPVSFVILADLSSSMTHKLPFVQQAALSLLDPQQENTRQINFLRREQGSDEYSVLGVGRRSELLLPFTNDQPDIEERLPELLEPTNESTALFDGVWLGVDTADQNAASNNRVMIVITDGGDNHSRYSLGETKRMLEESDVPVFAVMAGPSLDLTQFLFPIPRASRRPRDPGQPVPTGPLGKLPSFPNLPNAPLDTKNRDYIGPAERRGPKNMQILAEASGGAVFTANHEQDLERIVQTIGLAVRYRCVLTYAPDRLFSHPVHASVSGVHKVRVELSPKEKFSGYSVPYYKNTYRASE